MKDLVNPNGIIGNSNGTKLYIADYGASKIYQYNIGDDGTLSDKQLFASLQDDGLSIDRDGYIYAAGQRIFIYSELGQLKETLDVEGKITNLCITEKNHKTAYITTHRRVYKIVFNN